MGLTGLPEETLPSRKHNGVPQRLRSGRPGVLPEPIQPAQLDPPHLLPRATSLLPGSSPGAVTAASDTASHVVGRGPRRVSLQRDYSSSTYKVQTNSYWEFY